MKEEIATIKYKSFKGKYILGDFYVGFYKC